MTPQQIVGLFVRVFAVWLAVSGIQLIGYGVSLNAQPAADTVAPYTIAAILFILAVVLWFFPMVVAHKLVPRTQYDDVLRIPAHEAAVIACLILGLWVFVARALPMLSQQLSIAVILLKSNEPLSAMGNGYIARITEGLVELAVALVLTFKARYIANFFLLPRANDRDE